MRDVPPQAKAQFDVFTLGQARAMGWTEQALRHAIGTGRLIRVRRSAFAVAATDLTGPALLRRRLGQRAVAAALTVSRSTVSHASAAAVHGLPLLDCPDRPCLTLPPPLRTREALLHLHRQPIPSAQLDHTFAVPLTSVARSCIDLNRECGLTAGLVAADAAVHRGSCTAADLDAVYDTCRGGSGLPSGRQILQLLDGRSESPLESISRLAMVPLGPLPRSQVELFTSEGRFIARVDFYWDALGLVGEADGREKYTGDQLWREKRREQALVDRGLVVERWGWAEARRPELLRARLRSAAARAGRFRAAGIRITASCGPKRS